MRRRWPRSGFIYQNIMYAVAGDVVEAASGMPWEEFVRRRIFGPLAMSRTAATLRETQARDNVASPHDRIDGDIRTIRNASVDPVAGNVDGDLRRRTTGSAGPPGDRRNHAPPHGGERVGRAEDRLVSLIA